MKKIFALGLIGLAACVAAARADIIPSFAGASTIGDPSNPSTIFSYDVDITSQQSATSGDFFTIYDFGSFVSGSNVQPSGWTFSSSLVGTTPAQTNPTDNASLFNLTWTYNGPTISGATPAGQGIGPFQVTILGPMPTLGRADFAAQGTMANGANSGTKVSNVGRITVPSAPTAVPEPSTVALIATAGLGLIGRASFRRRKS
jgi:PEP-CTERM motif